MLPEARRVVQDATVVQKQKIPTPSRLRSTHSLRRKLITPGPSEAPEAAGKRNSPLDMKANLTFILKIECV